MKYIANIIGLVLCWLFFQSCEKELMDYEGKDALYFDVQYGAEWGDFSVWAHQIYTLVPFGAIDDAETEVDIKVAIAGSVKDYDRPFRIEIVQDSTTAICPDEYEDFAKEHVIKKGESFTNIRIKFKRTERMSKGNVQLQIRLLPNEHFELPFSLVGNIPGRWVDVVTEYGSNFDPNIHNIFINNVLTSPAGWNDVQFGQFSPKKYEMLLEETGRVFGFTKLSFEDPIKMINGRDIAIARVGANYLKAEYAKGREFWVLDEDGSMMWVRGVTWTEGTNPDDMVDN